MFVSVIVKRGRVDSAEVVDMLPQIVLAVVFCHRYNIRCCIQCVLVFSYINSRLISDYRIRAIALKQQYSGLHKIQFLQVHFETVSTVWKLG